MIKTMRITSTKYSQEGLNVSIKGDKISVTKGKLIYDKDYELTSGVSLTIDKETDILLLVEDLTTKEILVATSDGSIDKIKYRLIERLAWKKDGNWHKIKIEPVPQPEQAGKYNYEGLNKKSIKKGLKIFQDGRKTIEPDGQIR